MEQKTEILNPKSSREIIFYKDGANQIKVEVLLLNENLWLTQAKIAELFGVDRSVVTKHLKSIFDDQELEADSACAKIAHTAADGKNYNTNFYNLDAIIAVGYRVNSKRATMFRIWANKILKEYIIKGYVMNDERLKQPEYYFGKDYFEEQLERIRDISEVFETYHKAFLLKIEVKETKSAEYSGEFYSIIEIKAELFNLLTGETVNSWKAESKGAAYSKNEAVSDGITKAVQEIIDQI